MADTAVTERRIRPIQDAVESGNWKQALKESDKWLKKGESSDRFLALRATVLIHQNDEKTKKKGITDLLNLCRKDPPVLNIDAIHQIQESLAATNLEAEEGLKLWQRAVTVKPNDLSLLTTWLNFSLGRGDWLGAQKATTALKKAFPKDRSYEFANILMCFMIHQDLSLPEKDRRLFGTLANRFITKAAADKAISTIDELNLLAAILTQTGSNNELIQILQNPALKSVIDQDRSSSDHLLIEAVASSGDDHLMLTTAQSLLTRQSLSAADSLVEDDRIWSLLEAAAKNDELDAQCLAVVAEKLQQSQSDRRALLARIALLSPQAQTRTADESSFLDACSDYYAAFGSKSFFFDDLAPKLQACSDATLEEISKRFEHKYDEETNANKLLQKLKLRYFYLLRQGANEEDMLSLATDALDVHQHHFKSAGYIPEATMLAVMSLLQVRTPTGGLKFAHQANVLVHTLHTQFKDYYPFSVILLQLQRCSGQATLAMNTFLELNIKNLQWETLGHLILERISYFHPYQHGQGTESLNPLGGLDSALSVVASSQRSLGRAIREGLKFGSYANVLDTIKLRSQLKASVNSRICALEQRKIQRIRGIPASMTLPNLDVELVDLRDISFMPTYGADQSDLLRDLAAGPKPGRGWLSLMNLHNYLMTHFEADATVLSTSSGKQQLDTLSHCVAQCEELGPDLTDAEKRVSRLYQALAQIILSEEGQVAQANQWTSLADEVSTWKERSSLPSINGVEYPSFTWLQHQFLHLELLITITRFTAWTKQRAKSRKEKSTGAEDVKAIIDSLTSEVKQHAQAVRDDCQKVKQHLRESGVLGRLVDSAMFKGEEDAQLVQNALPLKLAECLEEAAVEQYCSEIRDSWEDAIEGVIKAASALR